MELILVNCDTIFWINILQIRNKDKENFVDQKEIELEEHFQYMLKYSNYYKVCIADGVFAGFVGNVNGDLRIGVSDHFKRKGIGKFMLENFKLFSNVKQVKVKTDNEASIKLFESFGFKKNLYLMSK